MARIGSRAPLSSWAIGPRPTRPGALTGCLLAGGIDGSEGSSPGCAPWRGQRVVGVLPRPDWVAIQAVELSTPSLGGKRSFGGSSSYAYSNAHIARDGERAPVVAWVFNQELAVRKTSFGRR